MTLSAEDIRPHQAEIIGSALEAAATRRPLSICGGRGTFKTSTLTRALADLLYAMTGVWGGLRIVVAGQTMKHLEAAFLDQWREQAEPGTYRIVGDEIRMRNDGKVLLWYAASPGAESDRAVRLAAEKRRGANVHGIYFPQAEPVSEVYHTALDAIIRITKPRPLLSADAAVPFPLIRWYDWNPQGLDHWLDRLFHANDAAWGADKSVRMRIQTTAETSVYSAEWIAERRRRWPAHIVARDLDGISTAGEGAMFALLDGYHVRDCPPIANHRWTVACDFGFYSDPFVATLARHGDGMIWIEDECRIVSPDPYAHLSQVRQMIQRATQRAQEREGIEVEVSGITGDMSGRYPNPAGNLPGSKVTQVIALNWLAAELEIPAVRTVSGPNTRIPGWKRISWWIGNESTPGLPRMSFARWVTETITSLRSLIYDSRKDDALPGNDHNADTIRYLTGSDAMTMKPDPSQLW